MGWALGIQEPRCGANRAVGFPGRGVLGAALTASPPHSTCSGGSWRCAEAPCPVAALCPRGLVHVPGSCLRRCGSTEPNGTCAGIADGCVCPPGTLFLVSDPFQGGSAGGLGKRQAGGAGHGALGAEWPGDMGIGGRGPGTMEHQGCGCGGLVRGTGGSQPFCWFLRRAPCAPQLTWGVLCQQDGRCVSPEECPCHHGGRLYQPNDTIVRDCNTW